MLSGVVEECFLFLLFTIYGYFVRDITRCLRLSLLSISSPVHSWFDWIHSSLIFSGCKLMEPNLCPQQHWESGSDSALCCLVLWHISPVPRTGDPCTITRTCTALYCTVQDTITGLTCPPVPYSMCWLSNICYGWPLALSGYRDHHGWVSSLMVGQADTFCSENHQWCYSSTSTFSIIQVKHHMTK